MHATCLKCRGVFTLPDHTPALQAVECPRCEEVMIWDDGLRIATTSEVRERARLLGDLIVADPRGGDPDATLVLDMDSTMERRASQVVLRIDNGPMQGGLFVLPNGTTVIGRGQGDIQLEDSEISRRHCALDVVGNRRISVRDLESSNGTWVNGTRIKDSRGLAGSDQIRCGETSITVLVSSE